MVSKRSAPAPRIFFWSFERGQQGTEALTLHSRAQSLLGASTQHCTPNCDPWTPWGEPGLWGTISVHQYFPPASPEVTFVRRGDKQGWEGRWLSQPWVHRQVLQPPPCPSQSFSCRCSGSALVQGSWNVGSGCCGNLRIPAWSFCPRTCKLEGSVSAQWSLPELGCSSGSALLSSSSWQREVGSSSIK